MNGISTRMHTGTRKVKIFILNINISMQCAVGIKNRQPTRRVWDTQCNMDADSDCGCDGSVCA